MGEVKFWGLRGSYPSCNKDNLKYGGNTTCVSIEIDGKLIIFDAGTGIINLGREYFDKYDEYHLFISHVHIDHIQGLLYFRPIFSKNKKVYIYGRGREGRSFEEILRGFISIDYFPVPFENMVGIKRIIEMDKKINLGCEIEVEALKINLHPIFGVLLFALNFKGKRIVFATDIECSPKCNPDIIKFMQNADILMHDSTYTDENYSNFIGWGHSTFETAIHNAKLAEVKKLFLIHYDPNENDEILNKREEFINKNFKNVYMPKERDTISL
jgi:phosphoribosyl 1,2-cyclic phosphodiesterase